MAKKNRKRTQASKQAAAKEEGEEYNKSLCTQVGNRIEEPYKRTC